MAEARKENRISSRESAANGFAGGYGREGLDRRLGPIPGARRKLALLPGVRSIDAVNPCSFDTGRRIVLSSRRMPVPEFKPDIDKVLRAAVAHTATHSPYYREQTWAKSARRGALISLKNIPITTKAVVRERTDQFFIADVPPSEGRVDVRFTSGSTGHPMEVRHTARFYEINKLEDARLARGWGFEDHPHAARIRNPDAAHSQGASEKEQQKSRVLHTLYSADAREAFAFVAKTGASLLTAHPQTALGILQHGADIGIRLPLKLVSTISEIIPEQLRALVETLPGCRLIDKYGTMETGIIATQCIDCGAYHPADRQSVIEILEDNDRPAKPGKMGRVIVTPLFNVAMPLIRYDTGDYVIVSKAPPCPRSSASIEQIAGRDRNLFKMAGGRIIVPRLDPKLMLALVRQFKMIQRTMTDIELLYVPKSHDSDLSQERAQELVDLCLAPGFRVSCVKVAELPRAANGKYIMHECLIS